MCRNASQDEEIREGIDHVSGFEFTVDPDRKALPRKLVYDVQHPVSSTVMRPVFDKVIRPDMVRIFRS